MKGLCRGGTENNEEANDICKPEQSQGPSLFLQSEGMSRKGVTQVHVCAHPDMNIFLYDLRKNSVFEFCNLILIYANHNVGSIQKLSISKQNHMLTPVIYY